MAGQVGDDGFDLDLAAAPHGGGGLFQRRRVAGDQDHITALLGQDLSAGSADALRAARHQSALACQAQIHGSTLLNAYAAFLIPPA